MTTTDADFETNVYVARVDAEMRAACVTDVSYQTSLCLAKGESYFGRSAAQFTLTQAPAKPLFLDLRVQAVANFTVNGTSVVAEGASFYRDHKLFLPTSLLRVGQVNKVTDIINNFRLR